jgi:hypothetical protein
VTQFETAHELQEDLFKRFETLDEELSILWEMAEKVDVQIYIQGKGPVHKLKVPLEGWDKNKIDLEIIMSKYRLRRLYAYSLTSGRGLELFFSPRNGLSLVSYSGKPGAIVRFDADPKVQLHSMICFHSRCQFFLSIGFSCIIRSVLNVSLM